MKISPKVVIAAENDKFSDIFFTTNGLTIETMKKGSGRTGPSVN